MSKLRLINVKSAIDSLNSDKISTSMLKSDLSSLEFANIKSPSASRSTSKVGIAPIEYTHLNNRLQATQNTVSKHVQLSEYLLKSIPNCLDFNVENQLLGDLSKAPFNFDRGKQVLIQAINELPVDKPLILRFAVKGVPSIASKIMITNYRDISGNQIGFFTISGNSKNELINNISRENLEDILRKAKGVDVFYSMPIILKYN